MTYDSKFDHWPTAVQANWPAKNAKVLTPSDTLDVTAAAPGDALSYYPKGLYIGTTGNLTVLMAGNKADDTTSVLFTSVPVGVFPIQVRRVLASGTTADKIVALFD